MSKGLRSYISTLPFCHGPTSISAWRIYHRQGATLDNDSRHHLMPKTIQKVRLVQATPKALTPHLQDLAIFDAMESLHDLKRHPSAIPAKWVDALSRPLGAVVPALTTKRKITRLCHRPDPARKSIYPNACGWPWSGAMLTHLLGELIDLVSASWTVPQRTPAGFRMEQCD